MNITADKPGYTENKMGYWLPITYVGYICIFTVIALAYAYDYKSDTFACMGALYVMSGMILSIFGTMRFHHINQKLFMVWYPILLLAVVSSVVIAVYYTYLDLFPH